MRISQSENCLKMSASRGFGGGAMFGHGAGNSSNKQDLALVEDTMTEVRRNWGLMLQEDVRYTLCIDQIADLSVQSHYHCLGYDSDGIRRIRTRPRPRAVHEAARKTGRVHGRHCGKVLHSLQ